MFSKLVALTVVLQLSLSLSAHSERCKLPSIREGDRGTSGLIQPTLLLFSQVHCFGYTGQVWADGSETRDRNSVTCWLISPDDHSNKALLFIYCLDPG